MTELQAHILGEDRTFAGLAMLYFPGRRKNSASRGLSKWIHDNTALTFSLVQAGWQKYQKTLTPKQIGIIVEKLGEP